MSLYRRTFADRDREIAKLRERISAWRTAAQAMVGALRSLL